MNRLKKMETSKKILGGSWAAAITLTVIVVVGSFIPGTDMSQVTILASAAWVELASAHGFYYWKAKNENRAKGAYKLIRELAEKHGIDAAARFAEIIFKD